MSHQNIIVTGANRGLGLEFVRQFLNSSPPPKNVIAAARHVSHQLTELKSQHSNLHILPYDAIDYKSYPQFVQKVREIVGEEGVDLLVNNAAVFLVNNLKTVKPEDMLSNFEVNAVAPLTLTQSLLPLLRESACKSRKTVIVNISSGCSISDYERGWNSYSYATSKVALNLISKALAEDLKMDGIIVLALRPGWLQTDMGGPGAELSPQESVSALMKVIHNADLSQSGTLIDRHGVVQKY